MVTTIQTITENDCSNKHWNELFEQTLKRTVQTNTKTVPRLFLLKLSAQFISLLQNHMGAGATFDCLFFDNSKVINFDD